MSNHSLAAGFPLDFIETEKPFPIYHFHFRVSREELDATLGRIGATGVEYRSAVRGPVDMQILQGLRGTVDWVPGDGRS